MADVAPSKVPPPVEVISAVISPKTAIKQVRFGANSRPPVKENLTGRPGRLTNFASGHSALSASLLGTESYKP